MTRTAEQIQATRDARGVQSWWVLRPGRMTTLTLIPELHRWGFNAWTPIRMVDKRDKARGRRKEAEAIIPGLIFVEGPDPAERLFDQFTWRLEDASRLIGFNFYTFCGLPARCTPSDIEKLRQLEGREELDVPLTDLRMGDLGEVDGFIFEGLTYRIVGWQGKKLLVAPKDTLMSIQIPASIFRAYPRSTP